jgi:hypothetical protein
MITKKYKSKKYSIKKSSRKNKEYVAVAPSGKKIHFADPTMSEYPGTKRGDNYCARSYGIGNLKNPKSANFWSRSLWSCDGKKSISRRRFQTIGK